MKDRIIAVIGAGNMGCAVADGILRGGLFPTEKLWLTRRNTERLRRFAELGCHVTDDNKAAANAADVIVIGVKPQMTKALFAEIAPFCAGKLVISICAGVTVQTVEDALTGCRVVRVMPNTPMMAGCGVNVLCRGKDVPDEDFEYAKAIFEKTGFALVCPESLINPVTALTSSSVAYFARIIDDMCKWAFENGFDGMDRTDVIRMVADTASGTAKLICEKGIEPAELVRAVTSPNGTTERANMVFDIRDLDGIIFEAMSACRDRADELSAD